MKVFTMRDGKKVEIEVVKIGGRFVEIDGFKTVKGKKTPNIKVNSISKKNAHGGTDITVQVPYLSLSAVENDLAGKPKGGN